MPRQQTAWAVWALGGLALLVLSFILGHVIWSGVDPPEAVVSTGGPAAVSAVAPPAEVGFPGVVLARDAVDLAPRVDGTLQSFRVGLGDRVKEGAVLALVDVGPVRQELRMAEARLEAARADHDKALLEHQLASDQLQRDEGIAAQLSAADLEKARVQAKLASTAAESAGAAVAESEARVSQLRELVEGGEIRAPFEGVVTERYLAPGARVGRTTPVLRLIGRRTLSVRFAVPRESAGKVAVGMPIRVEIDSSDLSLEGEVQSVSAELDPALQSLVAEARLNGGEGIAVPSGQSARIFLVPSRQAQRHP